MANRHPREELVVVLVSAQLERLRLLDGTEDNPLLGRKQETPVDASRVNSSLTAVQLHQRSIEPPRPPSSR